MNALRALMTGIVDYAGLFPPASLDMPTAIRNYVSYRDDPSSWVLGRFVAPVARLNELAAALADVGGRNDPIHITAVAGLDVASDVAAARSFNNTHRARAVVDSLEAKLATVDAIERAATAAGNDFELFAEVPVEVDPQELVAAVARCGISAKIRTGGVTADAFPSAANVARFLHRCLEANVRFKATAGLHHPLRADYALTYERSSPRGVMFGYLNVFVAAGLMTAGMPVADAERVLDEGDPESFEIGEDGIRWRHHSLSTDQLRRMRERFAVSFGSCSFREPVDELHALTPRV